MIGDNRPDKLNDCSNDLCQVNWRARHDLNLDPPRHRDPAAFSPFAAKSVTVWPLRQIALRLVMVRLVPALYVLQAAG